MSDATTPANPTGQIATVAAVLSPEPPIVPTSGTKRVPDDTEAAVVQDAQQYDWREDMDVIESCYDISECADGCCTYFTPRHNDECIRLAAYIERLEAERDALLAEHEAWTAWRTGEPSTSRKDWNRLTNAHDNAERVIRSE